VVIEGKMAGVQFAVGKPSIYTMFVGAEYIGGRFIPVELVCFFGPESCGIFY
jgi:hypothetical protein